MADPRFRRDEHAESNLLLQRAYASKPTPDEIVRMKQTGDENQRRLKQVLGTEPEAPAATFSPAQSGAPFTPPPPDTPDIIDRFHKGADYYITVSPRHDITKDPVPNPGQFWLIMDAYEYARDNIVPNFDSEDQRVVIVVFGGKYEEDIVLDSPQIDLYGIGQPIVVGTMTKDNVPVVKCLIEGLDLYGADTFAVDFDPFADLVPTEYAPPVPSALIVFFHCKIHSQASALRSCGRIYASECDIYVDYVDTDYGNYQEPAIHLYLGAHGGFSEFYRCTIMGSPNYRLGLAGFPDRGCAWRASALLSPAFTDEYVPSSNTGLMFRHCTIRGYGFNEVWNVFHDHCECYAGKVNGDAGDTYMFAVGVSTDFFPDDTPSRTWFNHTGVACRYLVEMGFVIGGVNVFPVNYVYLQHFKQLSNGGDWHGSMIVPGADPFGVGSAGVVSAGFSTVWGEHSISWREHYLFDGVNEAAILCNCDDDTQHHTNTNFVFGLGILQQMLPNPYQS